MISVKDLLLKETREAFDGNDEMSLKAALGKITQDEASWVPHPGMQTAEKMVRHLAWCKSWYCEQGFARPMLSVDEKAQNIGEALALLDQSQKTLMECLETCGEEALGQAIPTKCHGESAAHFFWIMLMHDIWHGGQIKTRRRAYRSRQGAGK
jgi:hypothetical protein